MLWPPETGSHENTILDETVFGFNALTSNIVDVTSHVPSLPMSILTLNLEAPATVLPAFLTVSQNVWFSLEYTLLANACLNKLGFDKHADVMLFQLQPAVEHAESEEHNWQFDAEQTGTVVVVVVVV